MNKVKWLVEESAFDDSGVRALMKEIKDQGMECINFDYKPTKVSPFADLPRSNECLVSYTGLGLSKRIRHDCAWNPGTYCSLPNFKCSKYYAYYYKYLLNREYLMMPLAQLINEVPYLVDRLNTYCKQFFIRPDRGDKPFAGIVLKQNEITSDNLGYGFYHEDMDLLVLVSEAISNEFMLKEWRFFVTKDKVLAGSQYKINGELEVSPEYEQGAWDFAQKILDEVDWVPDPIFVMDICKVGISENKNISDYYLLELNAASTSGLYDCDVKPIVKEMSELAYNEWKEIY